MEQLIPLIRLGLRIYFEGSRLADLSEARKNEIFKEEWNKFRDRDPKDLKDV